ncbi:CBS-domain-containing protein [Punctularia strigosozonata HHB-11173 SS5]|uniref:CBS-domain-containing protein n=1 Tax=Punctularia strigosozonata (strain HHB-11173) TaxID=741275 RepID=UPI00044170AA|nr:CBS-domain-containing protein [Punctularia strigosozonata HHB-11173 SS5]EIN13681.1 CBS-domain-containing protein [Punctularia strigosozonata HHB-11173 SS5]
MNATLSPTQQSPKVRRKPSARRPRTFSHLPPYQQTQETHDAALNAIRAFLRGRISYDAFPVSFRIIVLDTKLEVKKALQCLLNNGVVSAPLWNSEKSCFAGMLTVSDIIHLIQYYWNTSDYANVAADVESFRLESLREIEKSLGVATPPLLHDHPSSTLYNAAKLLIQTHARRLPLLDKDSETGHEVIVSVLTQYRLLKFISINCSKEISQLYMGLKKLGIGTYAQVTPSKPETMDGSKEPYWPIATASLTSSVFNVVHMFSQRGISAVPIIDEDGIVVNLYETVDVITLVRLGVYQSLDLRISEALKQRSADFPGVVICTASDSLGTLLQLIKKRRVHRLVVVEGEEKKGGRRGRLLGVITLSDVLRYVIGEVGIGHSISQAQDMEAPMDDDATPHVEQSKVLSEQRESGESNRAREVEPIPEAETEAAQEGDGHRPSAPDASFGHATAEFTADTPASLDASPPGTSEENQPS